MGIMDEDPLTELTDIHRKVIRRIERIDIPVMAEIDFPPYTVDIYIPDAHMSVEVDGPHHTKKRDEVRDTYLMETYNLPTIRITTAQAKKAHLVREVVQKAHDMWIESAEFRYEEVKEKIPWI